MDSLLREMLDCIERECRQAEQRARNNLLRFQFPPQDYLSSLPFSQVDEEFKRLIASIYGVMTSGPDTSSLTMFEMIRHSCQSAGYKDISEAQNHARLGTQGGLHQVLKQIIEAKLWEYLEIVASKPVEIYWGSEFEGGKLSGDILKRTEYIRQYVDCYRSALPEEYSSEAQQAVLALNGHMFFLRHYRMILQLKHF